MEESELVKLGDLIDMAFDLREDKRALEADVKDLKATLTTMETQIQERLLDMGVLTSKTAKATVTVTTQTVPQTDDFDAALNWIGEDFQERKHFLYRRILSGPFMELINTGESIPGLSPYEKRSLSLKKTPD